MHWKPIGLGVLATVVLSTSVTRAEEVRLVVQRPAATQAVAVASQPVATAPTTASTPPVWEPPVITGALDTVLTDRGDRITGRLTGISGEGVVRMVGTHYGGPVRIRLGHLKQLKFGTKKGTIGNHVVSITNNDRITGTIEDVTADAIIVRTPVAGRLAIARQAVRSIRIGRQAVGLAESHFDQGDMKPWQSKRGTWSVQGGAMVLQSSRHDAYVSTALKQDKPVTMVAQVEALSGRSLYCHLILFAEDESQYMGRTSVVASLRNSQYYLGFAQHNSHMPFQRGSLNRSVKKGTFRAAYDPSTTQLTVWLDNKKLGQAKIPIRTANGRFAIFSSRYPIRVKSLQVLPGIVPPPESGETPGAAAKGDQVHFVNGDHIAGQALTVNDGQLMIRTEYGVIPVAMDRIAQIRFGAADLVQPRRRRNDVRVDAVGCRMTVQFETFSDDAMTGKCEYLKGPVQLDRKALEQIQFQIYQK